MFEGKHPYVWSHGHALSGQVMNYYRAFESETETETEATKRD